MTWARALQVRLVQTKGGGRLAESLEAGRALEMRFVAQRAALVGHLRVLRLGAGIVMERQPKEIAPHQVQIGRALLAPRRIEKTRALGERFVVSAEPAEQL